MTAAMLDRLTVEAQLQPDTAGLRLNQDALGVGRLASRAAAAPVWVPVIAQARDVAMKRGGSRDGVTVAPQVGTLTVSGVDSAELQRVTPGTPVRVRRGVDVLFTGTANALHTTWARRRDLATVTAITTLRAVDAVQQLANTQRFGAVIEYQWPWQNNETLGQRARRLLTGQGLDWHAPGAEGSDFTQALPWGITSGVVEQGAASASGPAWYGFRFRAATPMREQAITVALPPTGVTELSAGVWVRRGSTATPNRVQRVLLELRAGSAGGPVLASRSHALPVGDTNRDWQYMEVAGEMPAAYASAGWVLTIRADEDANTSTSTGGLQATGATWATGPAAGCIGARFPLGSLVYESTLANHIDLAAASTGGAWWVDAHNVVNVTACRHSGAAEPLQLSDAPGSPWSYVAIEHAMDTARLANELRLDNKGRKENPDEPGEYVADDRTLGPFRNRTSVATYGPAAAEVTTGLAYDDAHGDVHAGAVDELAGIYLARGGAEFPSQVRLYRDPQDPPMPALDVMGPVDLTFRGTLYRCAIAGLDHEITPHRWHTTLTLVER